MPDLVQLKPSSGSRTRSFNLQMLRERLAAGRGPAFWRTLEEAADTEALKEFVEQEFPGLSGQVPTGIDRRKLLKVMGASLAMAGAAACTKQPKELIVPYVRQPENVIPGLPLFYATAMAIGGYARGLLVESHLNRPTKIEGNPEHPASLGATGIFEQASVLGLYDPDRSQSVMREGRLSTWSQFTGALSTEAQNVNLRKGEGLAVLTGATTSPTLISQLNDLLARWPQAKCYQHEPCANPARASAAASITGRPAIAIYDLEHADVIVSLDSDFLNAGPQSLALARQFSQRRKVDAGQTPCRLYAIEGTPSVSGSLADHHFRVRSGDIPSIAYRLTSACGVVDVPEPGGSAPQWLDAVARDLSGARGRSLVLPGEFQSESVHLAAHALNTVLGNVGRTVSWLEGVEPTNTHSLEELTNDLNSGRVETLIILGTNPVYSAAASLSFVDAIRKARFVVHLDDYFNETSRFSTWHVPQAHYLETWSDVRAFDGTATIQQPLVEPLYNGKSAHELLSILAGKPDQNAHDIVKGYWQSQDSSNTFDASWKTSLHNGFVAGTGSAPIPVRGSAALPPLSQPSGAFEVIFRPDPTIGDGSFTNNSWLQELPKPQSKLTWENAVTISPKTATDLKAANGDIVRVTVGNRSVTGPVWVLPGHSDDSATIYFGYGRQRSGRVGTNIGYNAYSVRNTDSLFVAGGSIAKTGDHVDVANVQHTQTMAGREPVRAADLSEFQQHPDFPTAVEKPLPPDQTLYFPSEWPYEGYKWGMSIDLNVCTGCSACIIACQAENNIAVVGKDQVAKGRHMHWIRVDRYYAGNLDDPEMYNQPVPCMHCENAPCELVCPVAATVHSNEGLNLMVYNRCVGTRYCSNNCPYKVRRFNFYLYSDWQTPSLYGLRNPDVTVRSRGVMEKCSYCIQRIQEAKIAAEKESRKVRDGEIQTACQQVCPTRAIVFGDLNDPDSAVTALQALPRGYKLLDELNTRPRTKYLAYVRNPSEAIRGPRGNRES